MSANFADQVKAFTDKVKLRNEAIFKTSAARVLEQASITEGNGGKMPVMDGFLVNSSMASLEGVPSGQSEPEKDKTYSAPVNEDPALTFLKMKVGDTVTVGWSAAYAMRMEYGYSGKDSLGRTYDFQGKGFLRAEVQKWDATVAAVTEEIKTRIP